MFLAQSSLRFQVLRFDRILAVTHMSTVNTVYQGHQGYDTSSISLRTFDCSSFIQGSSQFCYGRMLILQGPQGSCASLLRRHPTQVGLAPELLREVPKTSHFFDHMAFSPTTVLISGRANEALVFTEKQRRLEVGALIFW